MQTIQFHYPVFYRHETNIANEHKYFCNYAYGRGCFHHRLFCFKPSVQNKVQSNYEWVDCLKEDLGLKFSEISRFIRERYGLQVIHDVSLKDLKRYTKVQQCLKWGENSRTKNFILKHKNVPKERKHEESHSCVIIILSLLDILFMGDDRGCDLFSFRVFLPFCPPLMWCFVLFSVFAFVLCGLSWAPCQELIFSLEHRFAQGISESVWRPPS
jgi:hypothetical protein